MTLPRIVTSGILGAALLLSACGSRNADGETRLRDLRTYRGTPEEFAIVPNKPLEQPATFAELPAPAPGQANRADATPLEDAVAALGGDPARLAPSGIPASEAQLVAAAGRNGTDAAIRQDLAQADADFRRRKSIFSWRLVREDQYNRAYRNQSLDPNTWMDGVRRPGTNLRTPSAPPPGLQ
ncbi:DUF3035 domain-containing protein [Roseivivax isoporae]|uniref:Pyruvate/2-oxoglutarate dehydrogenase complex, dihydrolipoamide acyltransferase (E2) component n=1 Tax=Roseivivax isoporae LMG 25204 TaxID=1449351 RepID=X7FEK2_9RHOB|nr:DUF3035 domain-containing protein [Roseivivax isoporae]ETX30449.1 hypothetical protein RISW2_12325 [Roseivivax isoporae LMG 25204]